MNALFHNTAFSRPDGSSMFNVYHFFSDEAQVVKSQRPLLYLLL